MNLKVRLSSLGLNLDAVLLPSAMAPLMELIQQHRVPAEKLTMEERHPERPGPPRTPHGPHPRFSEQPRFRAPEWAPSTQPIQQQVALLDLEGLIALAGARTFPEKILALGGWITMHEQQPIIRSRQLKFLLIRLGMEPPANPGRDIRQGQPAHAATGRKAAAAADGRLLSDHLRQRQEEGLRGGRLGRCDCRSGYL